METLIDMLNYLTDLYLEAVDLYPIENDEEDNLIADLSEKGYYEDTEETLSRILYVCEKITELKYDNEEKYENIIYLLMIYYYYTNNKEVLIKIIEKDEVNFNLMNLIEESNIVELLEQVETSDDDYLEELVSIFIDDNFIFLYDDEKFEVKDYIKEIPYEIFNYTNKNETFKNIMLKLHPSINKEYKYYLRYDKKLDFSKKMNEINIKNTADFINYYVILSSTIKDKVLINNTVSELLKNILENNPNLYQNIAMFILKYYFVIRYFEEGNNINELKTEMAYETKNIVNLEYLDYISEYFYEFDFNVFAQKYNLLPDNDKLFLDKITDINKEKTYGIDGKWVTISHSEFLNLRDLINIYAYEWIHLFDQDNEGYTFDIFFSKDQNGKYTLPRLCIKSINNEMINIYEKNNKDLASQFELADILTDKLKSYNNEKICIKEGLVLNKYRNLYEKILDNKELSKEDIEFIYEIKEPIYHKYYIDERYRKVFDLLDHKKLLSNYFGCEKWEVAINNKEVNENTVVAIEFNNYSNKKTYPKLKYIIGDAFIHNIKNGKRLPSLIAITNSAHFFDLESTEGFDNLVYIGKDLFINDEVINNFNSKLYIGGETKVINKRGNNKSFGSY